VTALDWQKSSYSHEGANCVYVAATGTGEIKLRESDNTPDVIVTTTPAGLRALLRRIKAASGASN
jgi:hypothetical protein